MHHSTVDSLSKKGPQLVNKNIRMININQLSLLKPKDNTKHPTTSQKDRATADNPALSNKKILIKTIRKEQKIDFKSMMKPEEKKYPSLTPIYAIKPNEVISNPCGKLSVKNHNIASNQDSTESLLKNINKPSVMKKVLMNQESFKVSTTKLNNQAEMKKTLPRGLNHLNKLLVSNKKTALSIRTPPVPKDLVLLNSNNKHHLKEHKLTYTKLINSMKNSKCSLLRVNKVMDEVKRSTNILVPATSDFNYLVNEKSLLKSTNVSRLNSKRPENQVLLPTRTIDVSRVNPLIVYNNLDKQTKINATKVENSIQTFSLVNEFPTDTIFGFQELESKEDLNNENNKTLKYSNSNCDSDSNRTEQNISTLKSTNVFRLNVAKSPENQLLLPTNTGVSKNRKSPCIVYNKSNKQTKINTKKVKNSNLAFSLSRKFHTNEIFESQELKSKEDLNNENKKLKYTNSNCVSDSNIAEQNRFNSNKICRKLDESTDGSNLKGISPVLFRRLYHSNNVMNTFESVLYDDQPFHMVFPKPANTELWCMRKINDPVLAGYNPFRGDFGIEYDNSAEDIPIIAGKLIECSRDERNKDDLKLIKALAFTMTKIYNNRLSERHRRKKIVKKCGLINQRGTKTLVSRIETSIGKNALKKSIKAFQVYTPDETELLFSSLAIENEMKSNLNKMKLYRSQHGIKTMLDMAIFENGRCNDELGTTRFNVRNVALPAAEKRKRSVPQICHLPRFNDLSRKEADLCSILRLIPEMFLKAKENLITGCKRSNGLLLKTARKLVKIDVNKTRKIFDLLMQNGSIWPPGAL